MKTSWKDHAFPILLLLVAAAAVFGPSLSHEFLLNWDDPGYITQNAAIKAITWENIKTAFSTFYVGNYAPLQIISYMIDYSVWGKEPAGFIFSNIACHWASSILLYLLLIRFSICRTAAAAGALLFLLHPVQMESVLWISQRKNVLAMLFYLLALTMYIRSTEEPDQKGRTAYAISLLAFLAALLVKSVVVVLPLTLLLYDFCLPKGRRPLGLLLNKIPYILAAVTIASIALLSQSAEYGGGGRTGYHGGGPVATLLTMIPVLASYLRMIFWPSQLSVVYAPEIKTAIDGEVIVSALFMLPFIGGAILAFRRQRQLFFWITAIPVGLLPVAQIVPLVTLMNDRYLYFPMLGVAACFAFLIERILLSCQDKRPAPLFVLLSALLTVYAAASIKRGYVWQNSLTLWQDAVAKQPRSSVAWYMLGEVYEKKGLYYEAIRSEETARTGCKGVECRLILRKLSELYLHENRLDQAGSTIDALQTGFPQAAESYALMGHLYYQKGDMSGAERSYLKAESLDPQMTTILPPLGNIYLASSRPALAMQKFRQALSKGAPTAELAYSMACAEALMGNRQSALNYLDQSLRLGYNSPESIRQNPELDLLRNDREFHALIRKYFRNQPL